MSNGTKVRVYLDKRYVLGPEGAHVNIAGISGLATKTSYAMFLIQSILQTVGAKDIAVILLNVKQNDLLVIDKPRKSVKPEEQSSGNSWASEPSRSRTFGTYSRGERKHKQRVFQNCFGDLPDQFQTYAYGLEDVVGSRANPGPGSNCNSSTRSVGYVGCPHRRSTTRSK